MKVSCLSGASYAIVDIETNGMSATHGQIIEIGIIRVEDGEIVDTYQTLLRPHGLLSRMITNLTGIHDIELTDAPTFEDVSGRIQELLDGAIFVAHSARFDYSFVKNEFRRLGISWNAKTLCTVKLSRKLFPAESRHNLDAVMERHGISCARRHRAYDDAYVLWEFLADIDRSLAPETLEQAISFTLGNHTIPAGLDPKVVKSLPHSPGVYIFYNSDNEVLYVGKSVDIRTRVMSHFSGDHVSGKEQALCEQVAHIEYETTSGELSALLRESTLIKELNPIFNRRLRKVRKLAVVVSETNPAGYQTASLSYRDEIESSDFGRIEAVFRSISQGRTTLRKAVEEYQLCPKLIGLEKGTGACFSSQLGRCKGACRGAEAPNEYNKRFAEAFSTRRIKAWPFGGPIVLPEDPTADEGTAYLVDQWRIQKVVSYTAEGYAEEDADMDFDYDSYKILSTHLLKPEVHKKITRLTSQQLAVKNMSQLLEPDDVVLR